MMQKTSAISIFAAFVCAATLLFSCGPTEKDADAVSPEDVITAPESAEIPAIEQQAIRLSNEAMGKFHDYEMGRVSPSALNEAIIQLERARELAPDNMRIKGDYIQLLIATDKLEEALEMSQRRTELRPDAYEYLIYHAMLVDVISGLDEATPHYDRAIALLQKDFNPRRVAASDVQKGVDIALAHLIAGRKSEGYALIETLKSRHPDAMVWQFNPDLTEQKFDREAYLFSVFGR
ncbi:MAG: hypothetical protein LAT67_08170 [Balneolales bacterium]|nr:hypothetical protein [Balneolales bacterium]